MVVVKARDLNEAIELVNRNPYGNGAAIFTQSAVSSRKFEKKIEAGQVGVNVPIVCILPHSVMNSKELMLIKKKSLCLCPCSLGPETKPVSLETLLFTVLWDSISGPKLRRLRLYGEKMPKRIRLLLPCPFIINYFFGISSVLISAVHETLDLRVYLGS